MYATMKLLDDAITRGWANTAHLCEIRDCLIDEYGAELDTLEVRLDAAEAAITSKETTRD